MSQHPAFPGWRAVVVGGSIAGLLAARALAEACTQVTVVERDQYPQEPGFRGGTPRSLFAPAILARSPLTLSPDPDARPAPKNAARARTS